MSVDRRRTVAFWLLVALAFGGYCAWMSRIPLVEPDEGRYAEIPREMLASGDFVTPHLNGVKYFEKPPLYYWLNAAAIAVLGRTELAVRVWGLIFGLGGLWLTWRLAAATFGAAVGRRSALFLATSILYFMLSGVGLIDPALSFFLTACLTCFWLAAAGGEHTRRLWLGAAVAAALAVLTKGLIGIVLPGLVTGSFVVLGRRWDLLRRIPWVASAATFLIVAVPWHVAAALRNPDFLQFYFVHEHFLRYTTHVHARGGPLWYFVPVVLFGALPWTGLAPSAAVRALTAGRLLPAARRQALLFLWLWTAVIFGFFSASSSKLIPYVLPLFSPLAILLAETSLEAAESRLRRVAGGAASIVLALLAAAIAVACGGGFAAQFLEWVPALAVWTFSAAAALALAAAVWWWRRAEARSVAFAAVAVSLFLAGLLLLAPAYAVGRTSRAVAACLARQPDHQGRVYSFRSYPQSLPFYLGQTIAPVAYEGELSFGIGHLEPAARERRYPKVEELVPRWQSPERAYLVIEKRAKWKAAESGLTGFELLDAGRYVVLSNQPAVACEGPR